MAESHSQKKRREERQQDIVDAESGEVLLLFCGGADDVSEDLFPRDSDRTSTTGGRRTNETTRISGVSYISHDGAASSIMSCRPTGGNSDNILLARLSHISAPSGGGDGEANDEDAIRDLFPDALRVPFLGDDNAVQGNDDDDDDGVDEFLGSAVDGGLNVERALFEAAEERRALERSGMSMTAQQLFAEVDDHADDDAEHQQKSGKGEKISPKHVMRPSVGVRESFRRTLAVADMLRSSRRLPTSTHSGNETAFTGHQGDVSPLLAPELLSTFQQPPHIESNVANANQKLCSTAKDRLQASSFTSCRHPNRSATSHDEARALPLGTQKFVELTGQGRAKMNTPKSLGLRNRSDSRQGAPPPASPVLFQHQSNTTWASTTTGASSRANDIVNDMHQDVGQETKKEGRDTTLKAEGNQAPNAFMLFNAAWKHQLEANRTKTPLAPPNTAEDNVVKTSSVTEHPAVLMPPPLLPVRSSSNFVPPPPPIVPAVVPPPAPHAVNPPPVPTSVPTSGPLPVPLPAKGPAPVPVPPPPVLPPQNASGIPAPIPPPASPLVTKQPVVSFNQHQHQSVHYSTQRSSSAIGIQTSTSEAELLKPKVSFSGLEEVVVVDEDKPVTTPARSGQTPSGKPPIHPSSSQQVGVSRHGSSVTKDSTPNRTGSTTGSVSSMSRDASSSVVQQRAPSLTVRSISLPVSSAVDSGFVPYSVTGPAPIPRAVATPSGGTGGPTPRPQPLRRRYTANVPYEIPSWRIPYTVAAEYAEAFGVERLYPWQRACLTDYYDPAVMARPNATPLQVKTTHTSAPEPKPSGDGPQSGATAEAGASPSKARSASRASASEFLGVPESRSLLYCAPTSGGKTLVAEMILWLTIAPRHVNSLRGTSTSLGATAATTMSHDYGVRPVGIEQHLKSGAVELLEDSKKALYVVPYVALAEEVANKLSRLASTVGKRVRVHAGHKGQRNLADDILVCTTEKANILLSMFDERDKIEEIGVIVVDEVHQVCDQGRGYVLELLLTKIVCLMQTPRGAHIRLVCMSATLSNGHQLAKWLGDGHFFLTDFRPVPLHEHYVIGTHVHDSQGKTLRELKKGVMGDGNVAELAAEGLVGGFQVLVFCPTRAQCEATASAITALVNQEKPTVHPRLEALAAQRKGLIRQLCVAGGGRTAAHNASGVTGSMMNPRVEACLQQGIAHHHAALSSEERSLIESGFREGIIWVICCTTTLSTGINLPARRVIFKGPRISGQNMDAIRYRQAAGRAGRAGLDTVGEAFIVGKPAERSLMQRLIAATLPPVFSNFAKERMGMSRVLLDAVSRGTIRQPVEIQEFLPKTLLFATVPQEDVIKATREALDFIESHNFVEWDAQENSFFPTPLGDGTVAASLSPDDGILLFNELLKGKKNLKVDQDLHLVYHCTPFFGTIEPRWDVFASFYLGRLSNEELDVVYAIGLDQGFLNRCESIPPGRDASATDLTTMLHKRIYNALILYDVIREVTPAAIAEKYQVQRGEIYKLMEAGSQFASMVSTFADRLNWWFFPPLIDKMAVRLQRGVEPDILPLMRIQGLATFRARVLYRKGYRTVLSVASASTNELARILVVRRQFEAQRVAGGNTPGSGGRGAQMNAAPEDTLDLVKKLQQAAKLALQEEAEELRESISEIGGLLANQEESIQAQSVTRGRGGTKAKAKLSAANEDFTRVGDKRTVDESTDGALMDGEVGPAIPPPPQGDTMSTLMAKLLKNCSANGDENGESALKAWYTTSKAIPVLCDYAYGADVQVAQRRDENETENDGNNNVVIQPVRRQPPHVIEIVDTSDASQWEKTKQSILSQLVVAVDLQDVGDKEYVLCVSAPPTRQVDPNSGTARWCSTSWFLFESKNKPTDDADTESSTKRKQPPHQQQYLLFLANELLPNQHVTKIMHDAKNVLHCLIRLDLLQFDFLFDHVVHILDPLIADWMRHPEDKSGGKQSNALQLTGIHHVVLPRFVLGGNGDSGTADDAPGSGKVRYPSRLKTLEADDRWTRKENPAAIAARFPSEVIQLSLPCIATLRNMSTLARQLESKGVLEPYMNIEMPMILVLVHMEHVGIHFNTLEYREKLAKVREKAKSLINDAYAIAGESGWQLSSPADCAKILFDKLKLPVQEMTTDSKYLTKKRKRRGEQRSTKGTVLKALTRMFPDQKMPMIIAEYRTMAGWDEKYFMRLLRSCRNLSGTAPLIKDISDASFLNNIHVTSHRHGSGRRTLFMQQQGTDDNTTDGVPGGATLPFIGKIFGNYVQTGSATGRLSMNEPNLQTIPHPIEFRLGETETVSLKMRKAFIAMPGHVLVSADYRQIELRLLAHFSKDPKLMDTFLNETPDKDVFRTMAAEIKRKPESLITPDERREAKTLCYAILYGKGKNAVADDLDITVPDANKLLLQFRAKYIVAHRFMDSVCEKARKDGSVSTFMGRKRWLHAINSNNSSDKAASERQAVNTLCQGSAADIVKFAMIRFLHDFPELLRPEPNASGVTADVDGHVEDPKEKSRVPAAKMLLQIHDELLFEVREDQQDRVVAAIKKSMVDPFVDLLVVPLPVKVSVGPNWDELSTI